MTYASVCSGVEAASVAWEPLGWRPAWFSEIEPFPSAVLAHHFPNVPNLGDMTKIKGDEHGAIDLLVGGTPCQDLSIAGKRMGFAGKRSVLAIDFVRLAYESGAKFFAWENVPGIFSSNGGEDFAQLLSLFAGWQVDVPADGWGSFGVVEHSPGCFGLAWRVLDVQYARVDGFPRAIPQRRNRVFVVGYLGDWRRAAQVLFEPEGLLGNTPPRREAGKGVAEGAGRGVAAGRPWDETGVNPSLCRGGLGGIGASNQELFSQNCNGLVFDARGNGDGVTCPTVTGYHAGRPTDYTPVVCRMTAFGEYEIDGTASTMKQRDYKDATDLVVAFAQNSRDEVRLQNGDGQICGALAAEPGMKQQTYIAVQDVIHGDKACNGKGWNENGAAYTLDTMATQGVCVAFERRFVRTTGGQPAEGVNPCLRADTNSGDGAPCVAFGWNKSAAQSLRVDGQTTDALQASPSSNPAIACDFFVRRLTPIECERLMGFPPDWTRIPWRGKPAEDCPDVPRYKACGNSMGVNVMRWIGTRIQEVEDNQ